MLPIKVVITNVERHVPEANIQKFLISSEGSPIFSLWGFGAVLERFP